MLSGGSVTLTQRKESPHGSCQESGLEEDHQERSEDQGQEGQVSPSHGQSQRRKIKAPAHELVPGFCV
jgi:hypothetical protein